MLNIAEGSAKLSDKDFCRFLEISIGSLNETVACLDILFLEKELNQKDKIYFFSQAETLAKQIGAFIKLLRKKAHCQ